MLKITPRLKYIFSLLFIIFIIPLLLPGSLVIPVKQASNNDWNKGTFWYEPWGVSGVHKGIDIFARRHTDILSPTAGIVLYTGEIDVGGKVILTLGPKWRLHYFAHLEKISTQTGAIVSTGDIIGSVGDSGNAKGKQPHLHYSHITLLPYIWNIDSVTQGYKKAFYLNPIEYF